MAIVRANITAIRSLSAKSRTGIFAQLSEGARLAVFAEFHEFAGASAAPTTAAAQVPPPFALLVAADGRTARRLAERSAPGTGWGLPTPR